MKTRDNPGQAADRPSSSKANGLMLRVVAEIERRELKLGDAARGIGVGLATLRNHLAGEHVRSDSARKYVDWLEGRERGRNVFTLTTHVAAEISEATDSTPEPLPHPPAAPRLVVDIFSGCGGLSLGFDLLGDGRYFRTVLALDNQAAPVEVLNRNAYSLGHRGGPVGRQVDLTDFLNQSEFLAFYVGHVAEALVDPTITRDLHRLGNGAYPAFLQDVAVADQAYLAAIDAARSRSAWRTAYGRLDRQALGQTSVIGFFDRLRLPRPSLRPAGLPRILWADPTAKTGVEGNRAAARYVAQATAEWDTEIKAITTKRTAPGRGQLAASARRMQSFAQLLEDAAFKPVEAAWIAWRARRLELRTALFGDEGFSAALRTLYAARCPASVLVGGPPCQGFSRIGRGKIRSLREAQVHVQGSDEAGDARNLLFQQYVMVLGALRPQAFLFENVQHFQSTVKTGGGEFTATEVLSEAITNMSDGEVHYEVDSRVLDASRHGIPQARQRYFMSGVRADGDAAALEEARASLQLERLEEVPLSIALAGLPAPRPAGGDGGRGGMDLPVPVTSGTAVDGSFLAWVRQPCPASGTAPITVDGHAARTPRADDVMLFGLMGPGRRWMDYRSDDAATMIELGALLDALLALPADRLASAAESTEANPLARERLKDLRRRIDGSLPLRLLLEQSSKRLGVPHHLLTDTYLAKRDGNHGDWVARLDGSRPSKTMVSHMGKDTYSYVHPQAPRTISVREAARIQTFPDWFSFAGVALTDGFKMIGNAVPPMLSHAIAGRIAATLHRKESMPTEATRRRAGA